MRAWNRQRPSMGGRVIPVLLALFLVFGLAWQVTGWEKDVHHHLTYYLALRVGFTQVEAHTIASANLAIDTNATTAPSRVPGPPVTWAQLETLLTKAAADAKSATASIASARQALIDRFGKDKANAFFSGGVPFLFVIRIGMTQKLPYTGLVTNLAQWHAMLKHMPADLVGIAQTNLRRDKLAASDRDARDKAREGMPGIVKAGVERHSILMTGQLATNNAILWVAKASGTGGNQISVKLVNPNKANSRLTITVVNNKITVSLATDGNGTITSKAKDVITAIGKDGNAKTLVSVLNPEGSNGKGIVAPQGRISLSGGTNSMVAVLTTGRLVDANAIPKNNAILWVAKTTGAAGNQISVELANPNKANSLLTISVADNKITVSLATGPSPNKKITSTASDVITAIGAHANAKTLVSVLKAEGSDGSGIVDVQAATPLSRGTTKGRRQALWDRTIEALGRTDAKGNRLDLIYFGQYLHFMQDLFAHYGNIAAEIPWHAVASALGSCPDSLADGGLDEKTGRKPPWVAKGSTSTEAMVESTLEELKRFAQLLGKTPTGVALNDVKGILRTLSTKSDGSWKKIGGKSSEVTDIIKKIKEALEKDIQELKGKGGLDKSIPDTIPEPQALTFTGAGALLALGDLQGDLSVSAIEVVDWIDQGVRVRVEISNVGAHDAPASEVLLGIQAFMLQIEIGRFPLDPLPAGRSTAVEGVVPLTAEDLAGLEELVVTAFVIGSESEHDISNNSLSADIPLPSAPRADFTCSPTEGEAPLTVEFLDRSVGEITDWHWDFGDGNTSSSRNPSHTYHSFGRYQATLTVRGLGGSDTHEFRSIEVQSGLRVAIIYDVGGRGDMSFNDMAYVGGERAVEEFGLELVEVQSATAADYYPNLRNLASTGEYDLIIGVGFLFTDAMAEIAAEFPDQKFAIIDSVVAADNVMSIVFRENEVSALVGCLAAMAAADHGYAAAGVVLGIEIPVLYRYEAGFRFGMDWSLKKYAEMTGREASVSMLYRYTGTFSDIALGMMASEEMLAQGAVGIYNVAGPVGMGDHAAVAEYHAATETDYGPPYYFGIDSCEDWWGDGMHALASGMKRIDEACYRAVRSVLEGSFFGGIVGLGLAEGGVGLSDLDALVEFINLGVENGTIPPGDRDRIIENWTANRSTIPDWIWDAVDELKAGIIDGSVVVPWVNSLEEIYAIRALYPLK